MVAWGDISSFHLVFQFPTRHMKEILHLNQGTVIMIQALQSTLLEVLKKPFHVGLGLTYKRHSLDDASYEIPPVAKKPISGHSQTIAGYLDLGLRTPIASSLDAYMGVGLGYYLSLIEDPRKRKDHGFFATGSLGLAWNISDLIAFRFGYRYLHEKEVPSMWLN